MAALRIQFQSLCLAKTSPAILTRCASSGHKKKNGRYVWQARRVPTGQTQYANFLVKLNHKESWRDRQESVNKGWRQILLDVANNTSQLEEKVNKEPLKVFMVRRVKTCGGRPYWEKDQIAQLNLTEDNVIQIVENTQVNVGLLRKLSHLLEILPITFPYGLPETEEDLEHCILCDNGEFIFKKQMEQSQAKGIETTIVIPEDKWQITQELLDRTLELKKQKYQIHQEYFPTEYHWKRNEDGKEMRYKGDSNIGFDKIWY